MNTTDQLDAIADAYIPLLFLLSIGMLVRAALQKNYPLLRWQCAALLIGIVQIYAVMFLDRSFSIWIHFGLDYSTHTALALVFVVFLACRGRAALWLASTSMLLYCGLMMYQKYHTLADIISTAIVVLPLLIWVNINLPVARRA